MPTAPFQNIEWARPGEGGTRASREARWMEPRGSGIVRGAEVGRGGA